MGNRRSARLSSSSLVTIDRLEPRRLLAAELVSVNVAGDGPGDAASGLTQRVVDSYDPSRDFSISADGQFVAFYTKASDLIEFTDTRDQIVRRNLETDETELVSLTSGGPNVGDDRSTKPLISADGRYVAFESRAGNLVVNDGDDEWDVYVRDMTADAPTLVSHGSAGANLGGIGGRLAGISRNGRFVLFTTVTRAEKVASDGGVTDINGEADLFVYDVQTGQTRCVSTNAAGNATGDDVSGVNQVERGVVSDDGRFVLMTSAASDLLATPFAPEPPFAQELYVHDMTAGTNDLVTVRWNEPSRGPGAGIRDARMTPDGRYVVFASGSDALTQVGGAFGSDQNAANDVYLRDRTLGTTRLLSKDRSKNAVGLGAAASPDISDDGQFVVFSSGRDLLGDPNEPNALFHGAVYLWSARTDKLQIMNNVGSNLSATPFFGTLYPTISRDGRFVAYYAEAGDLVANAADAGDDGERDLVMRDRATATNHVAASDAEQFGGMLLPAAFCDDGTRLVFAGNNAPGGDTNPGEPLNVYVADVPGGEFARLFGGVLSIRGMYGHTAINVEEQTDGTILVRRETEHNGETLTFPADQIDSIKIECHNGDDVVNATTVSFDLFVDAGAGNDYIEAGGGADIILGGEGNDTVFGGAGEDRIAGGAGDDLLRGRAQKDQIDGGDGHDRIYGDGGNDKLAGAADADRLFGGDGNDILDGGSSDDRLDGGAGDDILFGQGGADRFYTDDNYPDQLFGGSGTDLSWKDDQDILSSVEGLI